MRIAIIVILLVAASGCQIPDAERVCMSGVIYYQTGYQLAPAFEKDGTLYLCQEKENVK